MKRDNPLLYLVVCLLLFGAVVVAVRFVVPLFMDFIDGYLLMREQKQDIISPEAMTVKRARYAVFTLFTCSLEEDRILTMDDMPPEMQGAFYDGWGTVMQFDFLSTDVLQLRSAGEDKEFGTTDDIARVYHLETNESGEVVVGPGGKEQEGIRASRPGTRFASGRCDLPCGVQSSLHRGELGGGGGEE